MFERLPVTDMESIHTVRGGHPPGPSEGLHRSRPSNSPKPQRSANGTQNGAVATLPARQERFCQEYLVDLNGTQAAVRAGYSAKSARAQAAQLLANLNVARRVQALQAEAAKRNQVSIDEVVDKLRQAHSEAVGARQFGPAVRALELLGKTLGMFVERQHHTQELARNSMSDSEVLRRFRNEYGDEAAEKAARKLGYKSADAAIEKKSSPA